MTPKLITLDSGDRAGKSTQAHLLYFWLLSQGISTKLTKEPGGSPLGQSIRQTLLHSDQGISPLAELLLYQADRAQHVARIRKNMDAGFWIVCDRFTASTIAYQGYGRGLDLGMISQLNQIATGGLTPDLQLWIDVPPEKAFAREGKRDRIESAGVEFHQRVYEGFKAQGLTRIGGCQGVEDVVRDIQGVVGELLAKENPAV